MWMLLGCQSLDVGMVEREMTMFNHWQGVSDAVAALEVEDDKAFKRSMRLLASSGEVPQTQYTGDLVSLQHRSKELLHEDDWGRRREGVETLVELCAGCHSVNSVAPVSAPSAPTAKLLDAVIWQSEERWAAACPPLRGAACETATRWKDRRALLVKGPPDRIPGVQQ